MRRALVHGVERKRGAESGVGEGKSRSIMVGHAGLTKRRPMSCSPVQTITELLVTASLKVDI